MQTRQYDKFKDILREMFQMDQADLDFGIYRIMNAKRDEIEKFLDKELLPQVKEEFAKYRGTEIEDKKKELAQLEATLRDSGMNPDDSPKVKTLREDIAKYGDDEALANEVFSHLTTFFRRYYDSGDFLSLRRYKKDTYAIPYEGEEVKLHWANADQYYIKTSEYLRDYAFKLSDGKRAHFKLVDASQEKDNIKAEAGKERKFRLHTEEPIRVEGKEVFIQFVYLPEKEKQDNLNKRTIEALLAEFSRKLKDFSELFAPAPTAKNPKRTLLEKHLYSYTARFNFDFFIHKDLGGFLRRELDFYVKNEVLFVDDLDAQDEKKLKSVVAKVKVIKHIAQKIIAFLAQLEDFQKKLWLKKKFVVNCGYCVTLDKVPDALYAGIVKNDAQREEWVKLFAIDEIQADLTKPGFSEPLTVEFLRANPYLVLDTKHFDEQFKEKLLASFDNLDESTDGVIINSDNFQALNLLQEKYIEKVKCIYIDPPYNTGSDGFVYKDTYQHSSWLAALQDRIMNSLGLIKQSGAQFISIDEIELSSLSLLCDSIFLPTNRVNFITVKTKVAGVSGSHHRKSLKNSTEYLLFYCKNSEEFMITGSVYEKEELMAYIENMKQEDKSWKYTQVLVSLGQRKEVSRFADGAGDEIILYEHMDYTFKPINQIAEEQYDGDNKKAYYANIDYLFDTTNAQSSIRQRVIEQSQGVASDLISITYKPRSGRNKGKLIDLFYKGPQRRLFTWLRDTVEIENDTIYKKDNAGNLWVDIQYNNIAKEGDVSFPNGKKPIDLISKAIKLVSISK